MGCDSCQSINPGVCAINDGVNELLKQCLHCNILIVISPIRFGTFNSITKNFIDRTEPLFLPYQISKNGRIIMQSRYSEYPYILCKGVTENNDKASIETFKNTVIGSSFSQISNKVSVKIINEISDFNSIKELIEEYD